MNKMCRTTNQSGRSMIEMLGVLAIIGVLSVGGIAGYSKAMMKFKINKTIDQITQISQNVRMLYGKQRQKNYRNLNTRILYKANLAPKEMFPRVNGGSSEFLVPAVGGALNVGVDSSRKYFSISAELPEEACIELATHDFGSRDTTGLISVYFIGAPKSHPVTENDVLENCSGVIGNGYAIACSGGSVVSTPMPVDVAVDAFEYDACGITWVFQ